MSALVLGVAATALTPRAVSGQESNCEVVATISAETKVDAFGKVISAEVDVQTICSDPNAPARAVGGGEGGASPCVTTPFGPLAEVQAVWAAVNAEQAPDPSDPNYVEDVYNPGGDPNDDVVVEQSWFRIQGADIQVKYMINCPGSANTVAHWVTVVPDSSGNLVPQVRAVDLVSAVHAQVVRSLPTPVLRVGPADEDPDGFAYVQYRTFFWVDQGPGQWETVSGTTSSGGVSVTVQAVPERLVVNPGDGSEAIVCVGAPVPVTSETYHRDIEGCAHRYLNSSAMAENGQTFPVVASIVWHASWSASTGEGGDLGYLSTTSGVRDLAVAEIQAVIIDSDP